MCVIESERVDTQGGGQIGVKESKRWEKKTIEKLENPSEAQ